MNSSKDGSPVQVERRQLVEARLLREGVVPIHRVAELLGFTPRWVHCLCDSGQLQKAFSLGRRHAVGVGLESLLKFVESEKKALEGKRTEQENPATSIDMLQPS